jgi:hypothetical protein
VVSVLKYAIKKVQQNYMLMGLSLVYIGHIDLLISWYHEKCVENLLKANKDISLE